MLSAFVVSRIGIVFVLDLACSLLWLWCGWTQNCLSRNDFARHFLSSNELHRSSQNTHPPKPWSVWYSFLQVTWNQFGTSFQLQCLARSCHHNFSGEIFAVVPFQKSSACVHICTIMYTILQFVCQIDRFSYYSEFTLSRVVTKLRDLWTTERPNHIQIISTQNEGSS